MAEKDQIELSVCIEDIDDNGGINAERDIQHKSIPFEEAATMRVQKRVLLDDVCDNSNGVTPLMEQKHDNQQKRLSEPEKKLSDTHFPIPWVMICISFLQIVVHFVKKPDREILQLKCDSLIKFYEIWRFFTPILIHQGRGDVDKEGGLLNNDIHLWGNIAAQITFGMAVEANLKWKLTGFVYLLSALFSSLGTLALLPCSSLIGANGAVSGLIMATVAEHVMNWTPTSRWRYAIIWLASCTFAGQVLLSWMSHAGNEVSIGVDESACFFGGVAGFLARVIFWKRHPLEEPHHLQTRWKTWVKIFCILTAVIFFILGLLIRLYYAISFNGIVELRYIHGLNPSIDVVTDGSLDKDLALQVLKGYCNL